MVNTKDQSMQYIVCYVCCICQHWCLKILHNTVYSVLCIQGLLPLQEERLVVAIYPVGLVVHQSEEAASFYAKFLGLVNYKGNCRQDIEPIPPFLKLRALSNLGFLQIYATKLHPSHPNLDCLPIYTLKCLKNGSL